MTSLAANDVKRIHETARIVARGDRLSQSDFNNLQWEWESTIEPSDAEMREHFEIARSDGATTGVAGPRWMFHLFGLRHRAAEIGLSTPNGLILLQRRSPLKAHWPGAWDMAVAGHIPQDSNGAPMDFERGAWKEIAEEIGLRQEEAPAVLMEGALTPVGHPYTCFECDSAQNPPFYDAEVRQIYAGTLTGEGLARLRFSDGEVAALLLVFPDAAWQILAHEVVASGLRYSLPRYLDWLEKQPR